MTITEKQREQQAELQKNLWAIANDLRGNMDASEFRNYILGLIFYRFLSEKTEMQANILLREDDMSYAEAWEMDEYREGLEQELIARIGFVIAPQALFSNLIQKIENRTFEIEQLHEAISRVKGSARDERGQEDSDHLC